MFRKLSMLVAAAILAGSPSAGLAQGKKDSVVMAMALEPPGLDPTTAAAAAITRATRSSPRRCATAITAGQPG